MPDTYSDFYSLVGQDSEAKRYFASLPYSVKQAIGCSSENINSFDSLRDYTEKLLNSNQ